MLFKLPSGDGHGAVVCGLRQCSTSTASHGGFEKALKLGIGI
jgi:hypothetical protein